MYKRFPRSGVPIVRIRTKISTFDEEMSAILDEEIRYGGEGA